MIRTPMSVTSYCAYFVIVKDQRSEFWKFNLQKNCRNQSINVGKFKFKGFFSPKVDLIVVFLAFLESFGDKVQHFDVLIISYPWSAGGVLDIWSHIWPDEQMILPLPKFSLVIEKMNHCRPKRLDRIVFFSRRPTSYKKYQIEMAILESAERSW